MTDSVTPALVLDRDDPVRIELTVDTAQLLGGPLIADFARLCDRIEAGEAAVAVVRLTGIPPVAWPGEAGIHVVNKWERVLRRLERSAAVTVALVDGPVGGAALEILLASDYRIAVPGATVALPGAGAFWPGMALYRLANQVGAAVARRLALFGSVLTAERAAELMVVDEVSQDPAARAAQLLADRAVDGSALAIRRQLLLDATHTSFEEALGVHLAACDRALRAGTGGPR
ncbi:enoyl-CoA hydratase/isomerase family protein [Micromonospora sp. KC207]|uniref:enoyl-CoA-hydratase DpgB n=1 Tax=Micromonospora sp. KC207 TaxID=2530377 RepID=UPI00104AB0A2|nr:enoyl-CoA-hydratase DpgB [Micromonospora sp. KC207]TDC49302.1 enoyl-CoA hydratase/isomerase family protein [Micromonospora sp. KC207]